MWPLSWQRGPAARRAAGLCRRHPRGNPGGRCGAHADGLGRHLPRGAGLDHRAKTLEARLELLCSGGGQFRLVACRYVYPGAAGAERGHWAVRCGPGDGHGADRRGRSVHSGGLFRGGGGNGPGEGFADAGRHLRLAQLAVISVGLLALAATPWVIRLMFGPRFAGAIPAAYLLVGSTMVWGLEQVLEQGPTRLPIILDPELFQTCWVWAYWLGWAFRYVFITDCSLAAAALGAQILKSEHPGGLLPLPAEDAGAKFLGL